MDHLTLLQQLIRERDMSYEAVTRELEDFSRTLRIDGTISTRHLQRLARRERTADGAGPSAQPGTRRLLREFFGHPFAELVAPPPALPPEPSASAPATHSHVAPGFDARSATTSAAQTSLDFLAWADEDRVAPALLDHVSNELARIAVQYVYLPAGPLFLDLVDLRDLTVRMLRDHPHPRQARELFFTAGAACTLLAHASQNLGNTAAARAQAAAAWACAEQADHSDLRGWVRGTQALIAEWSQDLPGAVRLAREGQQHATTVDSRVRLAAIEARALAKQGNADDAAAAVDRAAAERERGDRPDALTQFGGILTFPRVKQLYYAGTTLAVAGRPDRAETYATDAITVYETGPGHERSYGDEALARVDVAVARATRDDLDGAAEALAPVLQLPTTHRIEQIGTSLHRVRSQLALPRYATAPVARDLAGAIDDYTTPTQAELTSGQPDHHADNED